MYFASRLQAGRLLAKQMIKKYRHTNCAVIALNDGGVMVGAQIAMSLHCVLTLLESEAVELPRELEAVAGITEDGSFSYNQSYSPGELEEMIGEYYQYIEQEKLEKLQKLHRLLGGTGLIDKGLLKGHNVILVSDGLPNGFALDLAVQFLKPIAVDKIIVATPMASVAAVDHMHVLADDIYCLSVVGDYIATKHYYDQQDVPSHEAVIKTIEQIVSKWH